MTLLLLFRGHADSAICTEFSLAANADDAVANGTTVETDGIESLGEECAFRFTGMSALNGATIVSAYLAVTTNDGGGVIGHSTLITCEDADSAAQFTDGAAYSTFTARPRTAGTAWDIPNGAITDETEYESPNFAADLQAVIDRAGWTDTVQVFWDNDGSDPSLPIYMRDGDPAKAAVLRVCYTPRVEADPDTLYGWLEASAAGRLHGGVAGRLHSEARGRLHGSQNSEN